MAAEAALEPRPCRVGWGFISLYTFAYMSTSLLFLAPVLVTLALKVNSLVGIKQAPGSLALVAGIGALVAMVGNPFFGRMSDRTASRLGMRRSAPSSERSPSFPCGGSDESGPPLRPGTDSGRAPSRGPGRAVGG